MEIILSIHCKSLHGSLDKTHGYVVRQTRSGKFVGVRKPGLIPADGHLRFIFDLAEMAASGLLVNDIKVQGKELNQALDEAGYSTKRVGFPPNSVFTHKTMLKIKECLNQ